MLTKDELLAFEADIAAEFNAARIRAPVHLSGGNEDELIRIFGHVGPEDWVCTNWRSHYHCLLKGVPPAEVKAAIMAGRSITLCFPDHKVISSAIVGGIVPIAVGLAWAAKKKGSGERVWCFVGDMTFMAGIVRECQMYADRNDLPIAFVIEDNGLSVCTPTEVAWGSQEGLYTHHLQYGYRLPWPHSGAGKRVEF